MPGSPNWGGWTSSWPMQASTLRVHRRGSSPRKRGTARSASISPAFGTPSRPRRGTCQTRVARSSSSAPPTVYAAQPTPRTTPLLSTRWWVWHGPWPMSWVDGGSGSTPSTPRAVATAMTLNDATFKRLRPDLDKPTADDVAAVLAARHLLPVPWVEPVDVANAVVFLASDEARYITGTQLVVDAGLTQKS